MLGLVPWDVDRRLQAFLEEDLGFADITTQGLGDLGKNTVKAKVTAKKEGVMAGGYFALRVFTLLNSQTRGKAKVFEGQNFPPGSAIRNRRTSAGYPHGRENCLKPPATPLWYCHQNPRAGKAGGRLARESSHTRKTSRVCGFLKNMP